MINLVALLAAVEIDEYLKQRATEPGLQRSTHESIFLFGVLLTLALALFIWAYFLRRKRHRLHARRKHSPPLSQYNAGKVVTVLQGGRRRRKRYRRRREHRPRNPTLAETGGLPPIRSEDQPPPPL
jgi:hypothetical protein